MKHFAKNQLIGNLIYFLQVGNQSGSRKYLFFNNMSHKRCKWNNLDSISNFQCLFLGSAWPCRTTWKTRNTRKEGNAAVKALQFFPSVFCLLINTDQKRLINFCNSSRNIGKLVKGTALNQAFFALEAFRERC